MVVPFCRSRSVEPVSDGRSDLSDTLKFEPVLAFKSLFLGLKTKVNDFTKIVNAALTKRPIS